MAVARATAAQDLQLAFYAAASQRGFDESHARDSILGRREVEIERIGLLVRKPRRNRADDVAVDVREGLEDGGAVGAVHGRAAAAIDSALKLRRRHLSRLEATKIEPE